MMRRTPPVIFVLFVFILVYSAGADITKAKLAIGDWEPYTSKNNSNCKIAEEIVSEAFQLVNIEVEYEYYPWVRSKSMVRHGQADGTFPWNMTGERQKNFYFHDKPLISDEGVFFHLKSTDFNWEEIDDIKKYKVGSTLGFKQVEYYKSKGIEVDVAPSDELNLKKLLSGRIDVYETSKIVGYHLIGELFSEDNADLFTHHQRPVEINEYYIMFSRNSRGKELRRLFNKGLEDLKTSGRYDEILTEYGIK